MSDKDYIQFLGTAGGRFVVARQVRSSAGTYLSLQGERIVLDPGPGTLLRCAQVEPAVDASKLTGIILTHAHVDHSTDVNVMIDSMTAGGWQPKGALFAPSDALHGEDPVVLKYLRSFLDSIHELRPEEDYRLGKLRFRTSVRHHHGLETYGVIVETPSRRVAFLVDTKYFDGLLESYRQCDVLVINVVLLDRDEAGRILHLSLPEAKEIIRAVRPRKAVITHMGMHMLKANPEALAQGLSDELGVEVVAAFDGMKLELN